MDNKKTGKFIAELRKEQGLNQKELAEKINVTDKAVSKWETGRGAPDISLLIPLANTLGVSVSEVLSGEKMLQIEASADNDKQLVKKLKIKRIIRLSAELFFALIIAVLFCISFNETRKSFNLIDIIVHGETIGYLSICMAILVVIFIFWIVFIAATAVLQKKSIILKTIIVCLIVSFVVGSTVHIGNLEESIVLEKYNEPIDTISYVNYDALFDDTYKTQIKLFDCYEPISSCYEAKFKSADNKNYINTLCAVFTESEDLENAIKGRVSRKAISGKYDFTEVDYYFRQKTGITQGYIVEDFDEDTDVLLCFAKGNTFYEIETSLTDFENDALISQIALLP